MLLAGALEADHASVKLAYVLAHSVDSICHPIHRERRRSLLDDHLRIGSLDSSDRREHAVADQLEDGVDARQQSILPPPQTSHVILLLELTRMLRLLFGKRRRTDRSERVRLAHVEERLVAMIAHDLAFGFGLTLAFAFAFLACFAASDIFACFA